VSALAVTQVIPAVLGSRTTEPYWVAIPILGLFMLMRVMRARARGGGARGGGPWGRGATGPAQDPPVQWDIRKAPQPETTPEATPEASGEERNPPSDL
jgi:hypothetical protein